ncbi:hypothetical protein RR46_02380 [Papilio xuthus]|uniref:Uncharacterized protein n=1 Tax=Papilio xuthus TaxID=66420 RepID=A0A194Q1G3_PAPXU|nr:hypothetical protein RR46_02380 [Papilio xuthus]
MTWSINTGNTRPPRRHAAPLRRRPAAPQPRSPAALALNATYHVFNDKNNTDRDACARHFRVRAHVRVPPAAHSALLRDTMRSIAKVVRCFRFVQRSRNASSDID